MYKHEVHKERRGVYHTEIEGDQRKGRVERLHNAKDVDILYDARSATMQYFFCFDEKVRARGGMARS